MASLIPRGVTWLRDAVTEFAPEDNRLHTAGGETVDYDYLVVAPGIQIQWDAIDGLKEAIGHDGVCSNYFYDLVDSTWQAIQATRGSNAIFTYPNTPIKCGGAPQKSPPDFIRKSPLANDAGWVDVDRATTQHTRYPNVFSLGDASSLPTSKTGAAIRKQAPVLVANKKIGEGPPAFSAAIRKQAPVLVANLLATIAGEAATATYDGYTSCPLVTGYGRLILAEFDYDGNPAETFPFDQSKERRSMYLMKKHLLPALYWHGMMRGRA